MIHVSPNIVLRDDELEESFVRSPGPGGQHVNTSSTGVQLRFAATASLSLPDDVRARLLALAGNRATEDGVIVITATRFRSQRANREDALARLVELIQEAEKRPKHRRKTRPTKASQKRRIQQKKRRGEVKQSRGTVRPPED